MEIKTEIQNIVKRTKAYNCVECGKCSSVCPISLLNGVCLPRVTVRKALFETTDVLLRDELLWSCLNCGLCFERCDFDVRFPEFIRDLRIVAHKMGQGGVLSHNGALQSIMRMMASAELRQNRLGWLSRGLETAEKGEYLYFVGCLPYFDTFFAYLDLDLLNIAKSTVKILNYLGITPVLMPDERCCGHDLYWTGDLESFKILAQLNWEAIKATGAKRVITSCPECYYMLKQEYPKYVGKMEVEVIHISQLLSENLPELKFRKPKAEGRKPRKVTFQDPCRLGRFAGVYEEPREVIAAVEGNKLYEMGKNRREAICCGTSGWMTCGTWSKQIQVARLEEARRTGAGLLITSCPKCMIHFKCAQADRDRAKRAKIEIQDLATFVAENLMERR